MPEILNRKDKKKQATHELLARQALQLFLLKGYDSTSIEELAEKADVARATIYNHFVNKDEILMFILDPIYDKGVEFLQAVEARKKVIGFDDILELCLFLWKDARDVFRLISRMDHIPLAEIQLKSQRFFTVIQDAFQKMNDPNSPVYRRFRFVPPSLTSLLIHKLFVPMLETIEALPDYETRFSEAMRALLILPEA